MMYGKAVFEEVNKLKVQPGKAIEISGAVLATALMQAGLVDEYRIFVQPVILGSVGQCFRQ